MKEVEYRAALLMERLGEPIRFQIIRVLARGPQSVKQLAKLMGRHPTTVSQHLATLRDLHVVRYRNRGKSTFYELKQPGVTRIVDLAIQTASQISSLNS